MRVRIGAVLAGVALVLTGCSDDKADPVACKAAMSGSSTGPAQWATDKSTRPAACKGLDDAAFNQLAAEWLAEFQKKAGEG